MNIGAFFDLDGTIVPPPSLERRFLRYLHWRKELGAVAGARWLARFCWRVWSDPVAAIQGNKTHLAGVRAAIVDAWVAWVARDSVLQFPGALRRLEWHATQGHRILLVSGTLQPLAEAVARQLPAPATVCATELESVQGRWTGEVLGEPVCGPAKARALERLAAQFGIDLHRSYAYGDRYADRWMLERVGRPVAINPSPRLARLARRYGWPVLEWRTSLRSEEMPAAPEQGAEVTAFRARRPLSVRTK